MNLYITDLEMLQATIEIIGAVFGMICIISLFLYKKTEVTIRLRHMFCANSLMQLLDAGAYIFRGNVDEVSVTMTRICNFFVFFLQLLLLLFAVNLTYDLIKGFGVQAKKSFKNVTYVLFVAAFVLLISNLFTNIMYHFDENNYYHRNTGWYFYTMITMIIMLLILIMVIYYRKQIGKGVIIGIVLYIALPLTTALIQSFVYGLSLNSMAVMIALVIILMVNIKLSKKKEYSDGEYRSARNLVGTLCMMFLLMLTMSTSVIFSTRKIQSISNELSKENTESIFYMIKNNIENEFYQPIAVSDTIAQNLSLMELFDPQITPADRDVTSDVVEILDSINKAFGYKIFFAICDNTGNYYTDKGLGRTIDRYNDLDDKWYLSFINKNIVRELNVDTDKDNNMTLNIFINHRITSDDGRLLGVCGAGLDMANLCVLMGEYEEQYGVEIYGIDSSGIITLSSDITKINTAYPGEIDFDELTSDTPIFEDLGQTSKVSTYLEDLGWYLVMIDNNPDKVDVGGIVTVCVIIFVFGVFIMAMVFAFWISREKSVTREIENSKKIAMTDKLTEMENRRGYDNKVFHIVDNNLMNNLIVVMLDVNGLKTINDTIGHDAGDELIKGAAGCIKEAFTPVGTAYRIGGDEFVALLNCDKIILADILETFRNNMKNWSGDKVKELSISLGYACAVDYPDASFDELERMADEAMYKNKSEYYRSSGRDRRRE